MGSASFNDLPEELLLRIIDYVDSRPPSEEKLRQEPSLRLTESKTRTLKILSLVSRRWRRLTLPYLFRHSRLRLDIPPRPEWRLCASCNPSILADRLCFPAIVPPDVHSHQYHVDLVRDATSKLNACIRSGKVNTMGVSLTEAERRKPLNALTWLPRFYHTLDDFLRFVQVQELASHVRSFVVYTDKMLSEKLDRFPHRATLLDWRYPASAAFWQHALSVIDPERVVIVAPPADMACLTNCAIDTFGDWAFSDMELHVLQLSQVAHHFTPDHHNGSTSYSNLKPTPSEFPGVAPSSLLHLRPWTHCSLNEGSFLKAYGTYEYFERGPPSLIYSIKNCLAPRINNVRDDEIGKGLQTLRSFQYTAIFPFTNHIDFNDMFGQLEVLDVQLAPDPQSGILDDKARTGKAELGDCWQELTGAHNDIARALSFPPERARRLFPHLQRFICRDYTIPALRDDLDQVFDVVGRHGLWTHDGTGTFERLDALEIEARGTQHPSVVE